MKDQMNELEAYFKYLMEHAKKTVEEKEKKK
jgi:hypothetical protein